MRSYCPGKNMEFLGAVNGWKPAGGMVKVGESPFARCRQTLFNTELRVQLMKHNLIIEDCNCNTYLLLVSFITYLLKTISNQVLVRQDILNFSGIDKDGEWVGQLYEILLILERKFKFRDNVWHDSPALIGIKKSRKSCKRRSCATLVQFSKAGTMSASSKIKVGHD